MDGAANRFAAAPEAFEGDLLHYVRLDRTDPAEVAEALVADPDLSAFLASGRKLAAEELVAFAAEAFAAGGRLIYLARGPDEWAGAVLANSGRQNGCLNLAYVTSPASRGLGLAATMACDLMRSIFDWSEEGAVHCAIWGDNAASLRTIEKCGFEYLGYLPSYIDPPPVMDHQFRMTRDLFPVRGRREVDIRLDPADPAVASFRPR